MSEPLIQTFECFAEELAKVYGKRRERRRGGGGGEEGCSFVEHEWFEDSAYKAGDVPAFGSRLATT